MSDDAKVTAIRWRRILFGFHLMVWLIVRLVVGSLPELPPAGIYDGLHGWALLVMAHGLVLAVLDGRDHAPLPFGLNRLIQPRERRWSLLAIDAALWIILTMAIATRTISMPLIIQFLVPLMLAYLGLTAFGIAHVGLVLYAEIHDRAYRKRKNDQKPKSVPLMLTDDGELVDFNFADETTGQDILRQ